LRDTDPGAPASPGPRKPCVPPVPTGNLVRYADRPRSCRSSEVPVMESAYHLLELDRTATRWFHCSCDRTVLLQAEMGSGAMVVLHVLPDHPAQMTATERDHPQQARFPDRAHELLCIRVQIWALRRQLHGLHPGAPQDLGELSHEQRVAVVEEVPSSFGGSRRRWLTQPATVRIRN
jgi:hypothetical protein